MELREDAFSGNVMEIFMGEHSQEKLKRREKTRTRRRKGKEKGWKLNSYGRKISKGENQ